MMVPFIKTRNSRKSVGTVSGKMVHRWWLVAIALPFLPMTQAITASPHAFTVRQMNETIALKINGDEFSHWITDTNDYTVLRDESGLYSYAKLTDDGKLVASNEMVGRSSPKSAKKNLRPPLANQNTAWNGSGASATTTTTTLEAKTKHQDACPQGSNCGHGGRLLRGSGSTTNRLTTHQRHRRTATVGTLKNLVILIKFRDHNRRTVPTKDQIDILMNSEEADPIYAPTGSLKMVYWENSYGQLTIDSYVADWIRVSRTEAYYAAGKSGVGSNRLVQEALIEALNELERRSFDFSQFDQDNDFHIDSITFLTSGYGAEWGGDGFENRIWSHQSAIDWTSSKTGVRITKYHVSPALWGTSGSSIGRVGVIAHETGHFLGLEDHYDIDYSGNGLGFFCLMASKFSCFQGPVVSFNFSHHSSFNLYYEDSWGYDGSQLYPPHMSAYSKMKLSWTTPVTPDNGINVVALSESPISSKSPNRLYKIGDGQFGYPKGEYLLIEYRKTDWLRGGIAIYHIDETAPYDDEGFPGQVDADGVGWPENGLHYKIALIPADGSYELERRKNHGNSLDLFKSGDFLVPSSVMSGDERFPNTDTYQRGLVDETGVEVYTLSEPNKDSMTFVFWNGKASGWSWLSGYFLKSAEMERAPTLSSPPVLEQMWWTLESESFDSGPGAFVLGSDAKIDDKICKSSGNCIKITNNQETSTVRIQIGVSFLAYLEIAFDFYSDGLLDGEAIRLEHALVGSDEWHLVQSWVMGEASFPDKMWTSTSVVLKLNDLYDALLQLRFRTTSEKQGFYMDNVVIRGK